jgi:ATP-dependent RNA helicase DeaD
MKTVTREELIEKLASLELRKFIEYYQGASDINDTATTRRDRSSGDIDGGNYQRFFLSVGELDGLDKKSMLRWLNDCGLGDVEFGKIRIQRTHTFLEAGHEHTARVMEVLNREKLNERKVRVELQGASSDDGGFSRRRGSGDGGGGRGRFSGGGGGNSGGGDRNRSYGSNRGGNDRYADKKKPKRW